MLVTEQLFATLAQGVQGAAAGEPAEHLGQAADVLGDRHAVVVEDHQHVRFRLHATGVVERLVDHAGGHRTIANHRHHLAFLAQTLGRNGHAQGGRDRGAGMTDAEVVERAFIALRKRRHAVLLLHRMNGVAAPGQDLVRVGSVPDIPDDAVFRRVVQVMQRDGEFDHAKAGAEMAANLGDGIDQVAAQFRGDGRQVRFRKLAQISRCGDARKVRVAGGINHVRPNSETGLSRPSVAGGKAAKAAVLRRFSPHRAGTVALGANSMAFGAACRRLAGSCPSGWAEALAKVGGCCEADR